jgi:CBS domain-containing protein
MSETAESLNGNEAAPMLEQRRTERLSEARERAATQQPLGLSVRDLLTWWGQKRRGSRVKQQVEEELAQCGLTTLPNFGSVTIDATVYLVAAPTEAEVTTCAVAEDDDTDVLEIGLKVGNLPSALGGVIHVNADATFEEAITQMLLNDYSQVAVLSGPYTLKGAVTWRTVGQFRPAHLSMKIGKAIVRAHEVQYDQDLIEILPTLAASDFVFVRNQHNAVAGIVTTADVVTAYGDLATPFFLIGEVDQLLRRAIAQVFTLKDVMERRRSEQTEPIQSFDDLGMGDYQRVLEHPASWAKLGWSLDRGAFVKRLNEIREIRNDVMHFDPDPLATDAVPKLRNFLKVLRGRVK